MNTTPREYADKKEIAHYFEYSNHGIEIVEEGLQEITFGEYLVENDALTRSQLLCALQMQDRKPDSRIGECIAALGYMPYREIERYLGKWNSMDIIVV